MKEQLIGSARWPWGWVNTRGDTEHSRVPAAPRKSVARLHALRCSALISNWVKAAVRSGNKTQHQTVRVIGANPANGVTRTPLEDCPSLWHVHRRGVRGSSLKEASGQGSPGLLPHNNTSAELSPRSTPPDASGAERKLAQEARESFVALIPVRFAQDALGASQPPFSQGSSLAASWHPGD